MTMQPRPPTSLYGYGAAQDDLSRFAERLDAERWGFLSDTDSLPLANNYQEAIHRLAIVGQPTLERLRRVMESGFLGCFEADCDVEAIGTLYDAIPAPPQKGFFICLSTEAAYQADLAKLLIETVRARAGNGKQDWDMIETVLQEAISNAIIHGNLGIESHMRGDLDGFAEFSLALENRLKDPAFARRRVTVRSWLEPQGVFGIEILDQGDGYNPSEKGESHDEAAHGRGLNIIRSCAKSIEYFDGGRGARMTFALEGNSMNDESVSDTADPGMPDNGVNSPSRELNLATLETPILVVDDDFVSRELIVSYLSAAGFKTIDTAENGRQALERIEETKPGLLVLDIVMPEMDGLEVCRRLRANEDHRGLPILVQTAHDKPDDRRRVFAVGATDLVFKPIHAEELVARVRIHIENMLLVKDMRRYQARVEHELSFARRMQIDMLPSEEELENIHRQYGVRISNRFTPSSELGGDFWGALRIGERMLGVYVVDFTGHGVMSALNTVRLHTMVREIPFALADPVAFTEEMNVRLAELLPTGQFATIIYGTLDTERDLFSYAAAAAPSPISGSSLSPVEAHDGSGMPLGISKSVKYTKRTIPMPMGGFVLLYSDALTESVDSSGEMFGDERLLKLVEDKYKAAQGRPFLDEVISQFQDSVVTPLDDDLTAVCLMRD